MLTRAQRDKWAEELESGKWKQARGTICRDNVTFCCLGVLSHAVLGNPAKGGYVSYPSELGGFAEWERFSSLNDDDELSFVEIAKHVWELPASDPDDELAEYVIQSKGILVP